jgi:hypothetical protein
MMEENVVVLNANYLAAKGKQKMKTLAVAE